VANAHIVVAGLETDHHTSEKTEKQIRHPQKARVRDDN